MGEPATIPALELRHRLALALDYANISKEDMAHHLDKQVTTVRNWVSGRRKPDRSNIKAWAEKCDVSFAWLVGEEGQEFSRLAWNGGTPMPVKPVKFHTAA